jgi:hypothetical protein
MVNDPTSTIVPDAPATALRRTRRVHPNGYLTPTLRALAHFGRNMFLMDLSAATPIGWVPDVWRAGTTVFTARSVPGEEIVLWLLPRPEALSDPEVPHHRVRYQHSSTTPATVEVPLAARWWVWEERCAGGDCGCGERSLAGVMSLLQPDAAQSAVAAHIELLEAVVDRLKTLHVLDSGGPHAVELVLMIADLTAELSAALLETSEQVSLTPTPSRR